MKLVCRKCGYEWNTNSTAKRISCSKCKTSITIPNHKAEPEIVKQAKPITIAEPIIIPSKQQVTAEVKFPKTLWKDARLSQRMMGLDNMGEKWLVLKVDNEGVLSL